MTVKRLPLHSQMRHLLGRAPAIHVQAPATYTVHTAAVQGFPRPLLAFLLGVLVLQASEARPAKRSVRALFLDTNALVSNEYLDLRVGGRFLLHLCQGLQLGEILVRGIWRLQLKGQVPAFALTIERLFFSSRLVSDKTST